MTESDTTLTLALPADFRHADVLRFYARDREQVAERVLDLRIEKALHWQGQPALLRLDFSTPGQAQAALQGADSTPAQLEQQLRSMLGLKQDIAACTPHTAITRKQAPCSLKPRACAYRKAPAPLKLPAGP
ncbi:hypothetical protein ULG90_02015 [Halopseudomonas pachastrellae]|nr:hypothetical protein ULG90_02015 [Halopseudomonas pachastrellae]